MTLQTLKEKQLEYLTYLFGQNDQIIYTPQIQIDFLYPLKLRLGWELSLCCN